MQRKFAIIASNYTVIFKRVIYLQTIFQKLSPTLPRLDRTKQVFLATTKPHLKLIH